MFKRNNRSRHIVPLALALALLATSLAGIPTQGTLTLAYGDARDTTRTAPDLAVPHYSPEAFPVSQSGLELIANHLR
ncbi:hypothetical protein [Aromatoleum diolicum]|uniref:Uncharacterized protein n=1 Tax=Aromatoleum diolicum TaxID=75796 RepID=A0ABX1QDF5_9RHOO|nr:hypothetical protein [Aromatoleum diolicum]NMG76429.1 hypothetical protein [Aromatoleum diolicum]